MSWLEVRYYSEDFRVSGRTRLPNLDSVLSLLYCVHGIIGTEVLPKANWKYDGSVWTTPLFRSHVRSGWVEIAIEL